MSRCPRWSLCGAGILVVLAAVAGAPPPVRADPAEPDDSADLGLSVTTIGATDLSPGDRFDYRLRVTNDGPATALDVTISDELPEAVAFVSSADGCRSKPGEHGGTVTCGSIGALTASSGLTFRFTVEVGPSYDRSGLVNAASVAATTSDPDHSNNQAEATTPGIYHRSTGLHLPITGLGLVLLLFEGLLVLVLGAAFLWLSQLRKV